MYQFDDTVGESRLLAMVNLAPVESNVGSEPVESDQSGDEPFVKSYEAGFPRAGSLGQSTLRGLQALEVCP